MLSRGDELLVLTDLAAEDQRPVRLQAQQGGPCLEGRPKLHQGRLAQLDVEREADGAKASRQVLGERLDRRALDETGGGRRGEGRAAVLPLL